MTLFSAGTAAPPRSSPSAAAGGPTSRLSRRRLSSPSSLKSSSGIDLALPAGHRGSHLGSDGTKWESEPGPRGAALGPGGSAGQAWPGRAGDAGLDRPQRLGAERVGPRPSGGAAGTAPRPPARSPFLCSLPAAPGSLHPAARSLRPAADPGTGAPRWRGRPGPARLGRPGCRPRHCRLS